MDKQALMKKMSAIFGFEVAESDLFPERVFFQVKTKSQKTAFLNLLSAPEYEIDANGLQEASIKIAGYDVRGDIEKLRSFGESKSLWQVFPERSTFAGLKNDLRVVLNQSYGEPFLFDDKIFEAIDGITSFDDVGAVEPGSDRCVYINIDTPEFEENLDQLAQLAQKQISMIAEGKMPGVISADFLRPKTPRPDSAKVFPFPSKGR